MSVTAQKNSSILEATSDIETTNSSSSLSSYVTARTHETSESWYDVKSDTEQQPELIKKFEHICNTNVIDQVLSEEDKALIKSINSLYFDGDSIDIESISITEDDMLEPHATDNCNVNVVNNPINSNSDSDFEIRMPIGRTKNNENHDDCYFRPVTSNIDTEQRQPKFVFLNDKHNVKDQSSQQRNLRICAETSRNASNSSEKFPLSHNNVSQDVQSKTHIIDNVNGTHLNLSSHDSSKSQHLLNQHSILPAKDGHEIKTWMNPYWSKSSQVDNAIPTSETNSHDIFISSQSIKRDNEISNKDRAPRTINSETISSTHLDEAKAATSSIETKANSLLIQTKPQTTTSREEKHEPCDQSNSNGSEPGTLTPSEYEDESSETTHQENKCLQSPLMNCSQENSNDNKSKSSNYALSSTPNKELWVNPYWKDGEIQSLESSQPPNQSDITSPPKEEQSISATTSKSKVEELQNESVPEKHPGVTISTKPQDKPFVNPYWKGNKQETSLPSNQDNKQSQSQADDVSMTPTNSSTVLDKPFENPYWKDKKPEADTSPKEQSVSSTTAPAEPTKPIISAPVKPFENPYWKDKKPETDTSPKEQSVSSTIAPAEPMKPIISAPLKPFENPYWKDKKPETDTPPREQNVPSTTAPAEPTKPIISAPVKPFENPYWKDKKPEADTSPKEQSVSSIIAPAEPMKPIISAPVKPFENPYWKDKKPETDTPPKEQNVPSTTAPAEPTKPIISAPVKPFENPYWKDKKPEADTSPKEQSVSSTIAPAEPMKPIISAPVKPFENPYWKDKKPEADTSPKEQSVSSTIAPAEPMKPIISAPVKPFENPYWKDKKPEADTSPKEQSVSSTIAPAEPMKPIISAPLKPFENPYWKDKKPEADTSPKEQSVSSIIAPAEPTKPIISAPLKPFENPYWKGKNTDTGILSTQYDKSTKSVPAPTTSKWTNPYWNKVNAPTTNIKPNVVLNAWIYDNESSLNSKIPPVPSFYKRIYPVEIPPTLTQHSVSINDCFQPLTKYNSNATGKQNDSYLYNENNDHMEDFSMNDDRMMSYRTLSSSTDNDRSKPIASNMFQLTNMNTMPPLNTRDTIPSQPKNNMPLTSAASKVESQPSIKNRIPFASTTDKQQSELLQCPSYAPNNHLSIPESAFIGLTQEEILEVKHVLRLLEIDPNAIPIIERSYQTGQSYIRNVQVSNSYYGSLSTYNNNVQTMPNPVPPRMPLQNNPSNIFTNFNSQAISTFSSPNILI